MSSDLTAALDAAEAVYDYCRKMAFLVAGGQLPQHVRDFFNNEMPALLGELSEARRQLRDELAARPAAGREDPEDGRPLPTGVEGHQLGRACFEVGDRCERGRGNSCRTECVEWAVEMSAEAGETEGPGLGGAR